MGCETGFYDNTVFKYDFKNFTIQCENSYTIDITRKISFHSNFHNEFNYCPDNIKRGDLTMTTNGINESKSNILCSSANCIQEKYITFGSVINGFETLDLMEQ